MAKKQKIQLSDGIHTTKGDKIFFSINYVFMILLAVITLYPMLYVLFCSFSSPNEFALVRGIMFRPAGFSVEGYRMVLKMSTLWQGYRNTLIYVLVGTSISMVMTIMGAYILSHTDFMLKKVTMILIVFTMYFGGGMIPTYLTVVQMGLNNTMWAVMLPGAVSVYNMIVLRTSFKGIPTALLESATIDGANDVTLLFRIILPLSGAALATITLFYAVGNWSAWYNAMVYLQKRRDLYPLQLYLRELLILDKNTDSFMNSLSGTSANSYLMKEIMKYCTIIVSTVPVLLIYPFVQKYFVKGVMVGAIKE